MKKLIAAAALCSALPLFAKITTGAPFSDGAVLQRGMDVPVWGRALPSNGGKKPDSLKVEFAGQEKIAKVAADGAWKVSLSPMEASKESRTMKLSALAGGTVLETREIKDVLVGEVWFASGQSNMEMPVRGFQGQPTIGGTEAILAARRASPAPAIPAEGKETP